MSTTRPGWVVKGAEVRTMVGDTVKVLQLLDNGMVAVRFADGERVVVHYTDLRPAAR